MADQVTPPATAAAGDAPKAPTRPVLDSSKSLSSQAATIMKLAETKAAKEESKEEPKDNDKPTDEPKDSDGPQLPAIEDPEDQPEQKPIELGTVEKYILDRLPTLRTRIKDGDSVKIVEFRDVSELPASFELADDAARAQFTVDVAAQVARAKDALTEYRQAELNNKVREFEAQEAREVAADLARLQRSGIIPKFQFKEDDEQFNSDPAVQLANKIYSLFRDTNDAYRKAGKTYRITFEDAADKYFARESRTKANDSQVAKDQPKEEKPKLTPAQKERQEIAKQTGAPAGGEPKPMRPVARAGMRFDDINRLVRMGRI
jgi:hypothetical protein